jgi:lysophospholipase L1-like esterase
MRFMKSVLATGMVLLLASSASAQSGNGGAADEWPFIRTSCSGAAGEPMQLVALGTSETAGWGIRTDESYAPQYSPQEAYPARYADILCEELGRPVELHSYFPDQFGGWFPIAWWNERLSGDAALRADLAAADVVVLWPLSSHDIGPVVVYGGCRGEWPDPLRACLEAATADIEPQMDVAFSTIAALVLDRATVLANDGFVMPPVLDAWGAEPYYEQVSQLANPHYVLERLAPRYGFTVVGTQAAFNGPSLREPPADGLLQVDGIHPTALGAQLMAETLAQEDGLDD